MVLTGERELIEKLKKRFSISNCIYFIIRVNLDTNEYDFFKERINLCPSITQIDFVNNIEEAAFHFGKFGKFTGCSNIWEDYDFLKESLNEDDNEDYFLMKFNGEIIERVSVFLYKKEGVITLFKDFLCKLKK